MRTGLGRDPTPPISFLNPPCPTEDDMGPPASTRRVLVPIEDYVLWFDEAEHRRSMVAGDKDKKNPKDWVSLPASRVSLPASTRAPHGVQAPRGPQQALRGPRDKGSHEALGANSGPSWGFSWAPPLPPPTSTLLSAFRKQTSSRWKTKLKTS